MQRHTAIILVLTLIAQALGAPQSKKKIDAPSTIRSPANLSLKELEYIVGVRRGEPVPPPKTLTPCARAILGCCQKSVMNESCSEALNCGAYFFDANPCSEKYVLDALNAARTFYDQFNLNNV
ncbi:uncharacterized protein LOC114362592 [Ostrinia furnacalis]|uniref:uncharacterized protein LOC114362592 n=1 Tax=Ostrinia furnacalis TaxID=93504 RepID=UPI001039575F|nr:uncharacterized protein LOC114362592 [Ostrinia furnacalis]